MLAKWPGNKAPGCQQGPDMCRHLTAFQEGKEVGRAIWSAWAILAGYETRIQPLSGGADRLPMPNALLKVGRGKQGFASYGGTHVGTKYLVLVSSPDKGILAPL